jgi:transcription antitermination factor NusG
MPTRSTEVTFHTGRSRAPEPQYDVPHWYACYTRSRHEKKVDELLRRQMIESYLPTTVRESQWKDRKQLVRFPLFPGYVFGRFTLHQLTQVLSTHGVAAVVSARGYPSPISDAEMENVRLVARAATDLATELVVEMERGALIQQGNWVRVADGPFQGVQGIVVERRGRRRVLVAIAAIGQGVEIDIGISDLVPIPAPL